VRKTKSTILSDKDTLEEKYAKLRQRLADEDYRKKWKVRKDNAKSHRRRYKKEKQKKEAEIKAAEIKEKRKVNPYWRIIVTSQKKVLVDILYTPSKDDAIQKFNKILIENKKDVRIPKKVLIKEHYIHEAKYELILLKRRKEDDPKETLIRNEMGQFVPNVATNEKWVIYEKADFYFEETYWVYGFHPRHQRKDFYYILEDILLKGVGKVNYHQKRVMVYKNKLIIEDDNYDFEMVICKTHEDCIRLYNELEKEIIPLKLKSIYWSGFVGDALYGRLIERIMEKTGWDIRKIKRNSTRP